ncbi:hypothetical protein C480_19554 [Natrialba aegyptia DSM 13077]|uniref:Uncharacterized protein n=1 Tax=Natrialba aegyptia DSM 13077 TaxID=1227491 RepID=M0APX6_9EURY|nr:hypothetical protein C480_19554 [Natrialba aegyptia DSM 13077]
MWSLLFPRHFCILLYFVWIINPLEELLFAISVFPSCIHQPFVTLCESKMAHSLPNVMAQCSQGPHATKRIIPIRLVWYNQSKVDRFVSPIVEIATTHIQ